MRKLKLQVQITIDGFISGPNGEMDWLTQNWCNELQEYVKNLTASCDTILLGRKLAEGFIPHWNSISESSNNPEYEAAKIFVDMPKVVFSKTLLTSPWHNATIAQGELVDEIRDLKNQNGRDMIVYGGGKFVSSLIKENLIDELHLFINPAVIGKGMPIFNAISTKRDFQLIHSSRFSCGIMVLTYRPN